MKHIALSLLTAHSWKCKVCTCHLNYWELYLLYLSLIGAWNWMLFSSSVGGLFSFKTTMQSHSNTSRLWFHYSQNQVLINITFTILLKSRLYLCISLYCIFYMFVYTLCMSLQLKVSWMCWMIIKGGSLFSLPSHIIPLMLCTEFWRASNIALEDIYATFMHRL